MHSAHINKWFKRIQYPLAVLTILLAIVCLGQGFNAFTFGKKAQAVTSLYGERILPNIETEKAFLAASVDNITATLGGITKNLKTADDAREAIQSALDSLLFSTHNDVYYTLWQGTTLVYSPLNPDFTGESFQHYLDANGNPFVQMLADNAHIGIGLTIAEKNATHMPPKLAYAKHIPHTPWHLSAFITPKATFIENALHGFEQNTRKGFLLLGFSFLGVSGLLTVYSPKVSNTLQADAPTQKTML